MFLAAPVRAADSDEDIDAAVQFYETRRLTRRFNMISRAKKYVAVLLVFVCVCMIFSPQTAYAAEDLSLIHI